MIQGILSALGNLGNLPGPPPIPTTASGPGLMSVSDIQNQTSGMSGAGMPPGGIMSLLQSPDLLKTLQGMQKMGNEQQPMAPMPMLPPPMTRGPMPSMMLPYSFAPRGMGFG